MSRPAAKPTMTPNVWDRAAAPPPRSPAGNRRIVVQAPLSTVETCFVTNGTDPARDQGTQKGWRSPYACQQLQLEWPIRVRCCWTPSCWVFDHVTGGKSRLVQF